MFVVGRDHYLSVLICVPPPSKNPDKDGAEICEALKKEFDSLYGLGWVVVCGKNFGAHAVHESHRFVYFYVGQHAFMFYKV